MGVWLPVWQAENVWNDAGAGHMPRFGHLSTRLVYRYKNREALCGVRARAARARARPSRLSLCLSCFPQRSPDPWSSLGLLTISHNLIKRVLNR